MSDGTESNKGQKKEMTFWEHLDEFRGIIFRMAATIIVLAIGAFCIMKWFFDVVVLAPCRPTFPTYNAFSFIKGDGDFLPDLASNDFAVNLMSINMGTQFMTHMSASLWLAATIAFPILLVMLWNFVSPALYPEEKRPVRRAFGFGMGMFYLGVLVGYFVVFPLALRFLSQYSLSSQIANQLTLESYMDTFYMILLSMGLVFEVPLLAWILGKIGVLHRNFFKKYRRHAIVIAAVIAAIITPTSDVFTLLIVFIPIYGLWELSACLVPRKSAAPVTENDENAVNEP